MGSEEKELAEVLRAHRARLKELKIQIARFGYNAPPQLITERDDIQALLNKDKPVLEPIVKGEISEEAQAALRQYGVPAAISNGIMLVELAVANVQKELVTNRKEFHDYRDQRFRESREEKIERRERQDQTDQNFERMNIRITRLQWVVIAAMVILAFLIGGRFL